MEKKNLKLVWTLLLKKQKFYWAKTDRYNTSNDVTDDVNEVRLQKYQKRLQQIMIHITTKFHQVPLVLSTLRQFRHQQNVGKIMSRAQCGQIDRCGQLDKLKWATSQ